MDRFGIQEALEIFVHEYWNSQDPEEYYNSQQWKAMRYLVLNIQGNKCNRCGIIDEHPHVHHCFGLENNFNPENDFEVLCFDCHDRHHGWRLSEQLH